MTIAEKQQQLVETLGQIKNPQERFAFVVNCGRKAPPLDSSLKTDAHRVEGCLAKLWFVAEVRDGKCYFRADSDSAIVKGIASMLCDFYSDQTPDEILSMDPAFLNQVGINQHLTPNRRNSLSKVWDRIRSYAEARRANRTGSVHVP